MPTDVVVSLVSSAAEFTKFVCEQAPSVRQADDPSDWLQLFVDLIKAIAWPVAAIIIATKYAKQIRDLLDRLKQAKFGSAELAFGDAVERATEKIAESEPDFEFDVEHAEPIRSVSVRPRDAILEAWIRVETAARDLASIYQSGTVTFHRGPAAIMRLLRKFNVVKPPEAEAFLSLRRLRNTAAHDADFAPPNDAVEEFVKLASALERSFRRSIESHRAAQPEDVDTTD